MIILPPPHRYNNWDDLSRENVSLEAHKAAKTGISVACIVLTFIIVFLSAMCNF
jgi:hypothetical protein